MKRNIIGLVGCGAWGKNILRDLIALNCRVYVAVRTAESQKKALELGAEKVFTYADDLPECDGYVVAVPIPDLAPVSMILLKRKKPIFAEKTLCLSMETADELEKAGGDKYIFVMHKWHYHPGIEALRVIAATRRLGEIEQLIMTRHDWKKSFHGGDVFWALAVHDLTIIKHILGYIPENIRAVNVIKNEGGLPVSVTAMLGDKPTTVLSVSGRHSSKVSGVSIHGNKGSAELHDALDDHITIRDLNGEEKVPIDTTFPLFLELKEFTEYLQGGPAPRYGLENAKEVTRALLNLREKAGL